MTENWDGHGAGLGDVVRRVAYEAATRREAEAARALESLSPAEFRALARLARSEGLLWLVAAAGRHVGGRDDLREKSDVWTREAVREDLFMERLLRLSTDLLGRAGVPYLLIKGACFRDTLYPATWMRGMSDVDLLVRKADVERAVHALRRAGFRLRTSYPTRPFSMRWSLERQLDAPGGGLVEVHGGPSYEPFGLFVDIEGVFERALATPMGLAPAWEDHLVLVSIHQARTGMLAGMRPFLDLALLIEMRSLDWGTTVERAASWGCGSALLYSLEAVRCLFGTEVPAWVMARLAPRGVRAALLKALVLRGAGGPVGGRMRVAPLGDAPLWVFDLWRPSLYALLLDRGGPRAAFLAWVAATRAVDLLVTHLTGWRRIAMIGS